MMVGLTYPCFDESDDRPDGNAGHGGGREDSSCPVCPGGVGVHRAVVLHRFQIRITRPFLESFLLFFQILFGISVFFYLAHGEL